MAEERGARVGGGHVAQDARAQHDAAEEGLVPAVRDEVGGGGGVEGPGFGGEVARGDLGEVGGADGFVEGGLVVLWFALWGDGGGGGGGGGRDVAGWRGGAFEGGGGEGFFDDARGVDLVVGCGCVGAGVL